MFKKSYLIIYVIIFILRQYNVIKDFIEACIFTGIYYYSYKPWNVSSDTHDGTLIYRFMFTHISRS